MTGQNRWEKELPLIESMLLEGQTFKAIGEALKVSKQRVYQIYTTHLKHLAGKKIGNPLAVEIKNKAMAEDAAALRAARKEHSGRETARHLDDISRAKSSAFSKKRENAKRTSWDWGIVPADVVFNDVCPYLGIPINWLGEYRDEDSPSFDRIDTTKGYLKGNVIVCSWRANRIKNNGTSEEHFKIAKTLKTLGY